MSKEKGGFTLFGIGGKSKGQKMDIGGFFWDGDEVTADNTRVEINLNNETQVKGTAIHPETGALVDVTAIINRENNFASFILPGEDGEESYWTPMTKITDGSDLFSTLSDLIGFKPKGKKK